MCFHQICPEIKHSGWKICNYIINCSMQLKANPCDVVPRYQSILWDFPMIFNDSCIIFDDRCATHYYCVLNVVSLHAVIAT